MQLQNYYYWFKDAIPTHVCDDIVRYAKQLQDQMAVTGQFSNKKELNKKQIQDLKKKRDSDIVWLSERWIYNAIHPYIHQANADANWNFKWDFSEQCQFTKYKKGQYYDWHCDSWDRPYDAPNTPSHGKTRKLSVTVSLSDDKDYKGGELEFDMRNIEPHLKANTHVLKEIRSKGSLVVFPSDVWHRVKPVTKGTRHSLVIWNVGDPFQ